MSLLPESSATIKSSMERYIKSIGRAYVNAVVLMSLLIGATYFTITIALDRHSLQQNIGFLTSNQFIRFQQLANQTRALMRASADPSLPLYVVSPMIEEVLRGIDEIRGMDRQLAELRDQIGHNLLERLNPHDVEATAARTELDQHLRAFLQRAERVAKASNEERRDRYTFWGPIDFATASDSALMRLFGQVIAHAHERSDGSIGNAKMIGTGLLILIAATLIIASTGLFGPLLRKLRNEHGKNVEFECRLRELAHTDALTGLSNRPSFAATLTHLFDRLKEQNKGFSMLLLDLDFFKAINDTYGHPAGDAVLEHIAAAIRKTIRASDVAARIGGDEFAVLLPEVVDPATLEAVARRAVVAIATGVEFEGRTLHVSASIGGAVVPTHATDEASLIRVTDLALYTAKARRNTAVVFDEDSLARQLEQNRLASDLPAAVERNEFEVHYQPKVCLRTMRHCGFEALVRWRHPKHGLLFPGAFLPLMEGSEVLAGMTNAVVTMVGRDLRTWKAAGLAPGSVAINLPEPLLNSARGFEILERAIQENNLSWSDFAAELTEDILLNRNAAQILSSVSRLRERGISVALDDFGTGFASLVHLRDFPFDELKIDRSFVSAIGSDNRSEQIIRATVNLASNLEKTCVAEGIETEEQAQFLTEVGCKIGQGYLYSKPIPAELTTAYLQRAHVPTEGARAAYPQLLTLQAV